MAGISVIVPVYKAEKYLADCVESILRQEYTDLEVILIDDGSPDLSGKLCDDYARQDYRVKVIHKENAGVSAARNTGLAAATGEYITFVDSDDYIEPVMYQDMMEIAKKYTCDFVMCDCLKEDSGRHIPYTHPIRSGYYDSKQLLTEYYPHLLMMENIEYPPTISNCVCLFCRELIENPVRYVEGVRFSEDLLFGAQLMRRANSFYYMKGAYYYHYRMNPDSATHTAAPDKWKDYLRLYQGAQETLGTDPAYDFHPQIDRMLLFFVYNAVGDILREDGMGKKEKVEKAREILTSPAVLEMFHRMKIRELPIPFKLKAQTFLYKYRVGIGLLIK